MGCQGAEVPMQWGDRCTETWQVFRERGAQSRAVNPIRDTTQGKRLGQVTAESNRR